MKVLDITDKLKDQEQPVLKVKELELPINDDAVSLLTVMELMEDGDMTPSNILYAAKTIFGEDGFEKLKSLKLNTENFETVISEAIEVVTGNPEGEPENPGTTSSMTGI